jgi:hypothetical protein
VTQARLLGAAIYPMSKRVDGKSVLTFNSGSSSLKFGLYLVAARDPDGLTSGEIETIGDGHCGLRASDAAGSILVDDTTKMALLLL